MNPYINAKRFFSSGIRKPLSVPSGTLARLKELKKEKDCIEKENQAFCDAVRAHDEHAKVLFEILEKYAETPCDKQTAETLSVEDAKLIWDGFSSKKIPYNRYSNYEKADRVRDFFDYLTTGKTPSEYHCKSPKLSKNMAWNVIWFLQSVSEVFSDCVERCSDCGHIYNQDCEGIYVDSDYKERGYYASAKWKHLCDNCRMKYRRPEND